VKPATIATPLETAVQAVARMGFKSGDILTSKYWDGVPLKFDVVDPKENVIWVFRMHRATPGTWAQGWRHKMKYLPADVAKLEGT
jgi:hypothetical protein